MISCQPRSNSLPATGAWPHLFAAIDAQREGPQTFRHVLAHAQLAAVAITKHEQFARDLRH